MRWKRCSNDRSISSIARPSRPAAIISAGAAYWRAQRPSMPPDQTGESWRDAALLLDMALAAEDALSFVAGLDERAFLASDLYQSAVIRKLEVIGEAAGRVSKSFCTAHPEIPWREMTGLRHRLIHGYGDVRLDIVWRVTTEMLPGLIAALRPLIPPEADRD